MAFVAIADRDHEHALHDPETFIRKYIWSQDHKVIAIQYALVAIGIGLVALVMSVLMRLQLVRATERERAPAADSPRWRRRSGAGTPPPPGGRSESLAVRPPASGRRTVR